MEEKQRKTKNQPKLLQSGNLCLQNSIKVEILQLILKQQGLEKCE